FSSRRRHTRCYRDWSSDVCSSDLDSAASERSHSQGRRACPPIHQIELMTILVHQAAAGTAVILNPVLRLLLEWPAKFPAPNHCRSEERRVGKERKTLRKR